MTLADTISLAFRNLGQSKLRTGLTALGVAIGIASLAGMVSLGVGLEDQLVGRFVQSGVFDAITVTATPAGRGFGGRGAGRGGPFGGGGRRGNARADTAAGTQTPAVRVALDDAAIKTIAAIAHVKDVYPNLRIPVEVKYEQVSEVSAATGVPMSARDQSPFNVPLFGAFFAGPADSSCMLSLEMAKRLTEHDPKDLVGQSLTLSYASAVAPGGLLGTVGGGGIERSDATCQIVGIVEREPGLALGGGAGVSGVMLPMARAIELDVRAVRTPQSVFGAPAASGGERSYQSLTVKVAGAQFTQDVEDQVKAGGFTAFSVNDALQGAKRAFLILDIVLSLIGSIALAVSSLGIVNTMVMSILERTREIGIMKAIGGTDVDIRRIFLVEASAIGLIGGVSGVALGWAVGRVVNFGANIYIQSQGGSPGNLFSLPLWLIGGAIGFSWVVSLIAGSYPAGRAARLNPIDALRHD